MKTYREKILHYGLGVALCGALSLSGYSVANAEPTMGSTITPANNQQVGPNVKFQNAYWVYYYRPYYHYYRWRPYYYHRYYYYRPYHHYYYRYYWY